MTVLPTIVSILLPEIDTFSHILHVSINFEKILHLVMKQA